MPAGGLSFAFPHLSFRLRAFLKEKQYVANFNASFPPEVSGEKIF
jgi:hypothetical protein